MNDMALHFSPVLPWPALIAFALMAIAIAVLSTLSARRFPVWRVFGTGLFLALLCGPSLLTETRVPAKGVAMSVVDQSTSQDIGARAGKTQRAVEALKEKLAAFPSIEWRVVESGGRKGETSLFGPLDRALADVPPDRRAGVILLTDGQVHDVPDLSSAPDRYGPVHTLLTGERDEIDRRVVVKEAPAYGIVGKDIRLTFRVDDLPKPGAPFSGLAEVAIQTDGKSFMTLSVRPGENETLDIPLTHAGQTVIELSTPGVRGELTESNNRTAITVNGVRDRLKVLLVSGLPHAGTRTWRNILTGDPAIDLIHFTILRDPTSLDAVPERELSLIPFPFQELFEEKLSGFDLIIFDRYRLNRILPPFYLENVARHVENGGALLEAGSGEAGPGGSLSSTPIGRILPGSATGAVHEGAFKPTLTAIGLRHPVTQPLGIEAQGWGPWYRQTIVETRTGETVMSGAGGLPLLTLSRYKDGRVAQLTSDQIWLWSRGHEGGGPQGELLRRLIHWLMKEPDLEENALTLTREGENILIRRRSLEATKMDVSVTLPDGNSQAISLSLQDDGSILEGRLPVLSDGVYTVSDGTGKAAIVVGDLNAPERRNLLSTPAILSPVAKASGGGILWLENDSVPDVRVIPSGRSLAGRNWIGVLDNGGTAISGKTLTPLLPPLAALILILAAILLPWWREGRKT